MSNSFIEGEIVKLKSGGPKMHVLDSKRVGSKELVSCCWFDKSLNRQIHIASSESLVRVIESDLTPTQKLFRTIPKRDGMIKNYKEGNLWFHSHKWFRNKEAEGDLEGVGSQAVVQPTITPKEAEGDLEGVGSHIVGKRGVVNSDVFDKYPGQPAFFMSFSETVQGARSFDRGSESHTLLEVQKPIILRDEIRNILLNHEFVMINWVKMEYGKAIEVDHELTPSEASERKFRLKSENYKIEREWRLQIKFIHSFRTFNDTLKFRWGRDIGNHFKFSSEK